MGRPSKKKLAEKAVDAVKAAYAAAEAVVDAEGPEALADALQVAEGALVDAESAADKAGTTNKFKEAFDTIRGLLAVDVAGETEAEPEAEPEADPVDDAGEAETEPETVPAPEAPAVDYPTVAPGKAITTKRGIIGPGEEINLEDFPEGSGSFADFVEREYIYTPGAKK